MTAEEFHKQWRSAGQLTDHITCYAACVFAEAYAEHVVSSKAAEATPSCICATNCHFDCEDKLCKCPHHLTATEAPGGQCVSGMSEDMKAHRRKAFAPDEVEAIEKEHEHSWLKKQAELEDNANCCIGCPPTEADFKALAVPAAPSERADELRVALLAWADEADQWRENGIKGGAVECRIGLEVLANKLRTWAGLSSQEGK